MLNTDPIMIIAFGNQKGGTGKSTLTILLANYLSLVQKRAVLVLDMDYQRSVFTRYEESRILENQQPYEVLDVELEQYAAIQDLFSKHPNQIILIDLPGKIDDDALLPVLKSVDRFVIPYAYDQFSYQATVLFSYVAMEVNPKAQLFFVPNRLKRSVNYQLLEQVNAEFAQMGTVTDALFDRVAFQRISTKDIPVELLSCLEPVFNSIVKDDRL